MKKIINKLIPLLLMVSIFSICGVYALFEYSRATADSQNYNFDQPNVADFYYPENLPTDIEGELYHAGVLEKIVSFDEGINQPNSLLSKAIEDRKSDNKDNVSSNQQVSGGNLKNTFSTIEGFENVGFVIHFDSDTQYSIYTYNNNDTNTTGVYIEVYKTYAILKDGVWVLSGGYRGEAKVVSYDGKTNGPYKRVIDPATWSKVD